MKHILVLCVGLLAGCGDRPEPQNAYANTRVFLTPYSVVERFDDTERGVTCYVSRGVSCVPTERR